MFCSIKPSQAEYFPVVIQELTVSPRSSPIQNFIQNHKVSIILITQQFTPYQECSTKQGHVVCNNGFSDYMQKIDNFVNPQTIVQIGRVIKTLYCNRLIPFIISFGMINNNEVLPHNCRLNYITYTG